LAGKTKSARYAVMPENSDASGGRATVILKKQTGSAATICRGASADESPIGKNSVRANAFRFALELGHCPMKLALRIFAKLGSYVVIRSPRRRGEWKHSRAPVAKMIPISTD